MLKYTYLNYRMNSLKMHGITFKRKKKGVRRKSKLHFSKRRELVVIL